jgi:transposase
MTTPTLPVLDPTAAAIAVGSETLHVSLAGGPPKVFGTTTGQWHARRDWLKEKGVRTVAMEAPGSYWLCPYEVLEQAGLAVVVVNGKDVKNLPGRKPAMKDCQWQATRHAHGLLKPGFGPPEHLRRWQDYLRLRADPIVLAGSHEQHRQQALERMKLKLHDVLSDLSGVSGLKLIAAILQGERQPSVLLGLCDSQIQKQQADPLRAALEGTGQAEHRFALRQAHEPWRCDQQQIAECDQQPSEKHFTTWLGLAPGSQPSGQRRGSQKRSRNRAGRLFCLIARRVGRRVDKALGGFYRRIKGRRGGLVANLALARQLAELCWRLMVHGRAYVESGLKKYEAKVAHTEQRLRQKLAAKYNLVLQIKTA